VLKGGGGKRESTFGIGLFASDWTGDWNDDDDNDDRPALPNCRVLDNGSILNDGNDLGLEETCETREVVSVSDDSQLQFKTSSSSSSVVSSKSKRIGVCGGTICCDCAIGCWTGCTGGKVQTLDWTTGMDYWTGILD